MLDTLGLNNLAELRTLVGKSKRQGQPVLSEAQATQIAEQFATVRAIELREGGRSVAGAVSAAVDRRTGAVYTSDSKKQGVHLHSVILEQAPERSGERWKVTDCRELRAVNEALWSGARLRDLVVFTTKVLTAAPYERCSNCKQTSAGTTVPSDGWDDSPARPQ